jgi:hypothetical protein
LRVERFAAGLALALAGISCAAAQELSAFVGRTYAVEPDANSFAWLISYSQDLGEHFALSFAWQNEGHVPGHHRDGHSGQAWAKARPFSPQLTLAAGIGPYRYFDTAVAQSGGSHADDHGYGVLYSVSATWRTQGRMLYEVRFNRVETNHSIDTSEVLLGVGYRLDQDPAPFAPASADASRSELTVFVGRTIVNSYESEQATAFSVEYKYAFRRALRASIAWLSEGDAELIRRNGLVVQGWYEPSFSGDRFTLGLGLGLYIAADDYREDREGAHPNGVITLSTSYRVGRDWRARFSWNRVISNYDRDTDVLMFGAGYRF